MAQTLQLEYACTDAEVKEAQALNTRQQLGGGSRWRAGLVTFFGIALAAGVVIFRFFHEISPAERPYFIALVVVICIAVMWWKRRKAKAKSKDAGTIKVEVSATEFAIVGKDSRVAMPWFAFGDCLESPALFVLLDRPKGVIYIVPKRVFPSESAQDWFRQLATHRPNPPDLPALESPQLTRAATKDQIMISFQLGFRDYLDRTLASWKIWGMLLFFMALFLGSFIYASFQPHPNAVYTFPQVFCFFVAPFLAVMAVVLFLVVSVYTWRIHVKYLMAQQIGLSEGGMEFLDRDASGHLPWSTYPRYKETRRSFILWRPDDNVWALLPKRAFASEHDMIRCRELLERKCQASRWFFG